MHAFRTHGTTSVKVLLEDACWDRSVQAPATHQRRRGEAAEQSVAFGCVCSRVPLAIHPMGGSRYVPPRILQQQEELLFA